MPIGYALGPRLRTRLTLGGLTFPRNDPGRIDLPQETLCFRRTGFPPVLSLLVPAYALADAPPLLAGAASMRSATLSYHLLAQVRDCGATLGVPVIFGAGWLDR
jgi:hypothetical protein